VLNFVGRIYIEKCVFHRRFRWKEEVLIQKSPGVTLLSNPRKSIVTDSSFLGLIKMSFSGGMTQGYKVVPFLAKLQLSFYSHLVEIIFFKKSNEFLTKKVETERLWPEILNFMDLLALNMLNLNP
jgi:hypothetical protein